MKEAGLLQRFKEIHKMPDKCRLRKVKMAEIRALTLPEVMAAFIILGVGLATAMFVFFLESVLSCVRRFAIHFKNKFGFYNYCNSFITGKV